MRAAAALCLLAALAGCGTSTPDDPALVRGYFDGLNAAAQRGAAAQREFFDRTQVPGSARACDLGDLTITAYAAMSTLRPDPDWTPRGGPRPAGSVYVVAVDLTVRRAGGALGNQIGSQRVVVQDGSAYGFAPCPTG
jgi:hypothetical protein